MSWRVLVLNIALYILCMEIRFKSEHVASESIRSLAHVAIFMIPYLAGRYSQRVETSGKAAK